MADKEIVVPKTPAKAYDPNRRPSDLLRRQIAHLEWALLPAAQRSPKRLKAQTVLTEAQAAEYIALLTARVQAAYAAGRTGPPAAGPLVPVRLPPVPPRAPRKVARKKTRKAARKKTGRVTRKVPRAASRKVTRKVARKKPRATARKVARKVKAGTARRPAGGRR